MTTAKIIGFTGPIGSGKGVLTDKLKSEDWDYISLSQLVREEARRRDVEETRDNLIDIGNDLRAKKGPGVLAGLAVEKINELGLEKYVIDGIRNPGEVEVLKQQENFYLIGVDAPSPVRYERAMERARQSDPKSIDELKAADERDMAIGVADCLAKSDLIIYNFNKTIAELRKELDEFMYEKKLEKRALTRPSKDQYYMNIAKEVATRATCIRRRYGAVIVKNNQIISTGYAGAPRGTPNCIDLGKCYRQEKNIPSGQNYDLCRSVHAEMNAIVHAGREKTIGAKIYIHGTDLENNNKPIEGKPCLLCKRMVMNSGIEEVITQRPDGIIKTYKISEWISESINHPFRELDEKL